MSERKKNKKVLYLSYDGLSDHIGQSQILPYLLACKEKDIDIGILTFEKSENQAKVQQIKDVLDLKGVNWHQISFSEGGNFSKAYDFLKFIFVAFRLSILENYTVIHSRSYFASSIGLLIKKLLGKKLIFDKRDFWIDAKVETGRLDLSKFSHRFIHAFLRYFEKRLFLDSDHIVSLTENAKQIVLQKYPSRKNDDITVIPCCVDVSLFDPASIPQSETLELRKKLGLEGSFVLGYVGSIDIAYRVGDLFECFSIIKEVIGKAKLLLLVNNDKEEVFRMADEKKIAREDVVVTSVVRSSMPAYISAIDCGFYFIMPSYAKQATSPTKLSEILAMGKQVVTNQGVGDAEYIFKELECGYLIPSFTNKEYKKAAFWLLQNPVSEKKYNLQKYSLEYGALQYFAVYQKLL